MHAKRSVGDGNDDRRFRSSKHGALLRRQLAGQGKLRRRSFAGRKRKTRIAAIAELKVPRDMTAGRTSDHRPGHHASRLVPTALPLYIMVRSAGFSSPLKNV